MNVAKVYLIGAGPGDPELITVKGAASSKAAMRFCTTIWRPLRCSLSAPARAERLYVGKKKSAHAFSQEEICGMLIDRARRGLTVARLKGGDPFLFGRGGEEAEALAEAGVPFEVVPGVTTPLGHRGVFRGSAHSPRTHFGGYVRDRPRRRAIDWSKLGQAETEPAKPPWGSPHSNT